MAQTTKRVLHCGDFDMEVGPLVEAMNRYPGITTESSCSGHGKYGMFVSFYADKAAVDAFGEVIPGGWQLVSRKCLLREPRKEPRETIMHYLYPGALHRMRFKVLVGDEAWKAADKLARYLFSRFPETPGSLEFLATLERPSFAG